MAKCAAIQFYSTFKCIFWTTLLMIGKFLWSHSKLKRAFFKAAATNSSESSPFSLANFWIRSICSRFVNTDNSWTNVEATFPLDANLEIWAQKSKKLIFPATRLEISNNWVEDTYAELMSLCRVKMKSMTKSWFCCRVQVDGNATVLNLNGISSETIKFKNFWKGKKSMKL